MPFFCSRYEIESLLKENREIRSVLKLANSDKNRTIDIQDTERLVDLIDSLDMYNARADAEEARIQELDAEVHLRNWLHVIQVKIIQKLALDIYI